MRSNQDDSSATTDYKPIIVRRWPSDNNGFL